jgi:hypothetical protein
MQCTLDHTFLAQQPLEAGDFAAGVAAVQPIVELLAAPAQAIAHLAAQANVCDR